MTQGHASVVVIVVVISLVSRSHCRQVLLLDLLLSLPPPAHLGLHHVLRTRGELPLSPQCLSGSAAQMLPAVVHSQAAVAAAHHAVAHTAHAGAIAANRRESPDIEHVQDGRRHRVHKVRQFRLLQRAVQVLQRVTQLQVTCAIFQFEDPLQTTVANEFVVCGRQVKKKEEILGLNITCRRLAGYPWNCFCQIVAPNRLSTFECPAVWMFECLNVCPRKRMIFPSAAKWPTATIGCHLMADCHSSYGYTAKNITYHIN